MSSSHAINSYDQAIELVERFAQCLLKDCKTSNELESVKQLAPYIAYFNTEIEMTKIRDKIYQDFLSTIVSATEKPDCDTVLKKFSDEIEKANINLKSSEKCKKYVSFMKMISQQNVGDGDDDDDDDDGEIKTISETVSTIDPISKLPIVEPVKNKKCGHTYDKTSILQLIEQNPKTKCPIAGCNAPGFVRKGDLVPDNALKRLLTNTNCSSQKKLKINE